jgi:tripartite-type tricarboxylate transporter receptor subunit TctC
MKFTVVLSLGLVLSPPWALAQTPASPAAPSVVVYPTKPIKIIVPFAAGGVTDIMARIVGNEMSKDMGQAVIVENVTGVSGVIGSQ